MIYAVHAGATVFAWQRTALVNINAAIFAGESCPTRASIIIVQINTRSTICTRFRQTQIHFARAIRTDKARHTLATVLID